MLYNMLSSIRKLEEIHFTFKQLTILLFITCINLFRFNIQVIVLKICVK